MTSRGRAQRLSELQYDRQRGWYDGERFGHGLDSNKWASGADGAGSVAITNWADTIPAAITLVAAGAQNNDVWMYHSAAGAAGTGGAFFIGPNSAGISTIIFECRFAIYLSAADVAGFIGLIAGNAVFANYTEPVQHCAHLFVDTAIDANFHVRTYEGAEQQTDAVAALDTNFHTLRMELTATQTAFYFDGALVATHAAQSPTRAMCPEFLLRTLDVGGAAKYLMVEWYEIQVRRTG